MMLVRDISESPVEILLDQAGRLMQAHDYAGAGALVDQALGIAPGNARGLAFGAVLAASAGRKDPALKLIKKALKLGPTNPVVVDSAAAIFYGSGQPHRARELWERLIELSPRSAKTFWSLALYHSNQDDVSAAEMYYRKAMELNPGVVGAYMNLGNVVKRSGRIGEAVSLYLEGARRHPEDIRQTGNYLLALNYDPSYGPEQIHAENVAWGGALESSVAGRTSHPNDRSPGRRLRVGYVSPDFRNHVAGIFFLPLLGNHDHSQFEIYCYSDARHPDEMTALFRQKADVWRETARLSDAELAAQVSEDRIDVLVDLIMHMEGSRLGMFARKPAPVQVTWLAYPGTTGLTRMDYRFTDPVLDPPGETDHLYTEQSIRLETYWCYGHPADSPAVGQLPADKNGYITFGCLNNFSKVNGAVLDLWREILAAVPDSRLILMPPRGKTKDWALEKLQVAPDRLVCLPRTSNPRYLDYYNRIDITLDPFPYTGHTTTFDCLWMGVPVITLPGPTVVSRGSLSILTNLGLAEFVVKSKSDYVALAISLSKDLARLRELRTGLRGKLERSVLMDGSRFARQVESVYYDIWRKWRSP
jgi:protein O-GlcNAc transferase